MIDTHCHVDLYPAPTDVAQEAARRGVLTVIVTNLPSAFERAYPYVRQISSMRLALGLHPLEANRHQEEIYLFSKLLDKTSYVGEVGLDFSSAGISTKEQQIRSFRHVLDCLRGCRKFVTIHSRRAESAVLDIVQEKDVSPVVFHWYTGPADVLRRAIASGHYFSINPAMIRSEKGRKLIDNIPPARVLTESDGPFVKMDNRSALPHDVEVVEEYMADAWAISRQSVRQQIRKNFLEILRPSTGSASGTATG